MGSSHVNSPHSVDRPTKSVLSISPNTTGIDHSDSVGPKLRGSDKFCVFTTLNSELMTRGFEVGVSELCDYDQAIAIISRVIC